VNRSAQATTDRSPRPRPRRRRRVVAVGVAVWAAFVVGTISDAGPAFAHAALVESTPVDGAVLDTAPREVVLRFSEPVKVTDGSLRVYDDRAVRVDRAEASLDAGDSVLRLPLPADLVEGTYLVSWRVLSEDSHVIKGGFVFSVGTVSGTREALAGAVDEPSDRGYRIAAGIARGLGYAGALLAVGGVVFLALVAGSRRARVAETRVLTGAALIAIVAAGAAVLVQTAITSGIGRSAFTDGALVRDTLADAFGTSMIVRSLGLVMLVAGLAIAAQLPVAQRYLPAGVGAACVVASFPLAGHTRTATPRLLVVIADIAHAAAVAVWFGGLVFLVMALRTRSRHGDREGEPDDGAGVLVQRFSRLATLAVAVVAASGISYAVAQTRSIDAITTTTYGRLLLIKVALVLVIGAFAFRNRRRWVPMATTAADRSGVSPVTSADGSNGDAVDDPDVFAAEAGWRRPVWRNARAEAAVMVAVLAMTSALVVARPGREAVAAEAEPFSSYLALGPDRQLNLVVDPAAVGTNDVHLYLLDDAGLPADFASDVRLVLTRTGGQTEPIEARLNQLTVSHFQATLLVLVPGTYDITAFARVSEFDEVSASTTVVFVP
jgi:copper transport protein